MAFVFRFSLIGETSSAQQQLAEGIEGLRAADRDHCGDRDDRDEFLRGLRLAQGIADRKSTMPARQVDPRELVDAGLTRSRQLARSRTIIGPGGQTRGRRCVSALLIGDSTRADKPAVLSR